MKNMKITSAVIYIFIAIGYTQLISCGPTKAELEAKEMQMAEQQKEQEQKDSTSGKLIVVSDSSKTNFEIPTENGSTYSGRLVTVKHDGCQYIVWFNDQGEQVIHKPNCSNPIHNK